MVPIFPRLLFALIFLSGAVSGWADVSPAWRRPADNETFGLPGSAATAGVVVQVEYEQGAPLVSIWTGNQKLGLRDVVVKPSATPVKRIFTARAVINSGAGTYPLRAEAGNGVTTATIPGPTITLIANPPVPVLSATATELTGSFAKLNATVDTRGVGLPSAEVFFEFGPTAAYGTTISDLSFVEALPVHRFSINRFPLEPGQTYHVRAGATIAGQTFYSPDTTFTTPASQPPVARPDLAVLDASGKCLIPCLQNDYDETEGLTQSLDVVSVTQGAHGTVQIRPLNSPQTPQYRYYLEYTAGATFPGRDTFTYTIQDPSGATAQTTVEIQSARQQHREIAGSYASALVSIGNATLPIGSISLQVNRLGAYTGRITIHGQTRAIAGGRSVGDLPEDPRCWFPGLGTVCGDRNYPRRSALSGGRVGQ